MSRITRILISLVVLVILASVASSIVLADDVTSCPQGTVVYTAGSILQVAPGFGVNHIRASASTADVTVGEIQVGELFIATANGFCATDASGDVYVWYQVMHRGTISGFTPDNVTNQWLTYVGAVASIPSTSTVVTLTATAIASVTPISATIVAPTEPCQGYTSAFRGTLTGTFVEHYDSDDVSIVRTNANIGPYNIAFYVPEGTTTFVVTGSAVCTEDGLFWPITITQGEQLNQSGWVVEYTPEHQQIILFDN